MLSKCFLLKSTVELGDICPQEPLVQMQRYSHVVEIQKETSVKMDTPFYIRIECKIQQKN